MPAPLLVVSDFDGTLAELDPDPLAVTLHPVAAAALSELALLPDTHVVILSGRELTELRSFFPPASPLEFFGCHGAQSVDTPGPDHLQRQLLDAIDELLAAPTDLRCAVEKKPFHRVFHVAQLAQTDPLLAAAILDEIEDLPVPQGVSVLRGKNVVEFSVTDVTKGTCLAQLIGTHRPDQVVFLGDDTTDESAFAVLRPGDIGIKVGDGATLANHRVPGVEAAADVLKTLARQRQSPRK